MGRKRNRKLSFVMAVLSCLVMCATSSVQWEINEIQQLNGKSERIKLPAKLRILTKGWTGKWTESWTRVVAVPYITYIPEKDRVLMMVSCGYDHQAVILASDDHGDTWSEPWYVHTDETGMGDTGMGVGFGYVGGGKVILWTGKYWLEQDDEDSRYLQWVSDDYGKTWRKGQRMPLTRGMPWYPPMVDRDSRTGKVTRLWATAYIEDHHRPVWSQSYLRQSVDGGRTWSELVKVPEWSATNEVNLIRAKNGDIVAALRTDIPVDLRDGAIDHSEGLGISISKDEGRSWSKVNKLYNWGRHHHSMVLLPDGDIVMTYAVRSGYVDTPDGHHQYGVEAVVSHDNGMTWDLDHKYIFAVWSARMEGKDAWIQGSQQTSSVLLPDGSILTAFGTNHRADFHMDDSGLYSPRDVGLVRWRVNNKGLNDDRTIIDAPFDSDLRNLFDPLMKSF